MVFGGIILIRDHIVLSDYGTHTSIVVMAALLSTFACWIWLERSIFLTMDILVGLPELDESGHGGRLLAEEGYIVASVTQGTSRLPSLCFRMRCSRTTSARTLPLSPSFHCCMLSYSLRSENCAADSVKNMLLTASASRAIYRRFHEVPDSAHYGVSAADF